MDRKTHSLLFILSTGHSGSTLLDMLLGAANGMWTLGEAHYLQESLSQGLACGCGKPYAQCEFWQAVFDKMDLAAEPIPTNFFQLRESRKFPRRMLWLLSILLGRPYLIPTKWIHSYDDANEALLNAIEEVLQDQNGQFSPWFVDATKHGHRLFWLLQDPRFRIKLVHLVKDPRAFVYSMVRRQGKHSIARVLGFAFYWMYANLLFLRMKANPALQGTVTVRYEDLAVDPQGTLKEIAKQLGITIEGVSTQNIRNKVNHAVGGNEMRLNLDITQIQLDEKWRTLLSPGHANLVWVICWPLAKWLGYEYN